MVSVPFRGLSVLRVYADAKSLLVEGVSVPFRGLSVLRDERLRHIHPPHLPRFRPLPGIERSPRPARWSARGLPKVSVTVRGLSVLRGSARSETGLCCFMVSVPFRGLSVLRVQSENMALVAQIKFPSPSGD